MRCVDDLPLRSATASVDRRNYAGRQAFVRRVQGEFDEMPGSCLTVGQASRLFGLPQDVMARVFDQLVGNGILRLAPDGRYRSRKCGV